MLLPDARDAQILFLSLFLALGIGTRDWSLRPEMLLLAIATCLLTQWGLSILRQKATGQSQATDGASMQLNWRSPLITALSLSLLLRVEHYPTMVLAGVLAIASKFWLQVGGKHCFNPANFAIIAVLLLTHDAWVIIAARRLDRRSLP
ncbi:MAG: hypothetical protein F6K19_00730 [Cyanothece sp. SIO1E1]|nr:hypothetical protein [Cyanothece sp. SIO1E1]